MTRGGVTNLIAVVGVAALVAGAAWLKSRRAEPALLDEGVPVATTSDAPAEADLRAQEAIEQPAARSENVDETPAPGDADALPVSDNDAPPPEPADTDGADPAVEPPAEPIAPTPDEPASAPDSADPPAATPRLVDLGSDKCKQCKALAPILDALREEYKGRLSVEFLDVWKDPDAAIPYKIRLIPTQILYDAEGTEVWRHEGFISKEDLKSLFAKKVGVR